MNERSEPIVVEQFELLLMRLQGNLNATQAQLTEMGTNTNRVAREALGLHAALTEAIRRLNRMHIPCDDLLRALDAPGEAPLNWPNATAQPSSAPTQAQLAAEYDRIYKRGEDA